MVELEDVVQAEGHHVIHTGFTTTEHHRENGFTLFRGEIKGLRQPLLRNLLTREVRIPGESPKSIPVSLREVVTTPVLVKTNIRHAGDAHKTIGIDKAEELLPHGSQINQMT